MSKRKSPEKPKKDIRQFFQVAKKLIALPEEKEKEDQEVLAEKQEKENISGTIVSHITIILRQYRLERLETSLLILYYTYNPISNASNFFYPRYTCL